MSDDNASSPSSGPPDQPGFRQKPMRPAPPSHGFRNLVGVILIFVIGYGLYFWEVRRVVVNPNEVLILLKKNGSRSLPGDNIIIPRPPDAKDPQYAAKYQAWEDQYGDCNGILEQVYPEGTYFGFSPIDYEREVVSIETTAIIPAGKVGIVIKKF